MSPATKLIGIDLAVFIAEHLMGWHQNKYARAEGNTYPSFAVGHGNIVVCRTPDGLPFDWNPHVNMAECWKVVENRHAAGWEFSLTWFEDFCVAGFYRICTPYIVELRSENPREAILLAAKATLEANTYGG